jgi:predicted permease
MSLWSRIANAFYPDRLSRDIDEEFESHIEYAIEDGINHEEARKAFGCVLRRRDETRDLRVIGWLDSLRADTLFGWRQLLKNKVTSAAAILSLALGIGSCTAAFRLIDALLLRPLAVVSPERLFDVYRQEIGWDGKPGTFDGWAYPAFREMRSAAKQQAELIAISYAQRNDLTYAHQQEVEKAYVQYVSGWMFSSFGIKPALGRLLTEADDLEPGLKPFAVLSYDYWTRRFGQDPKIIGQSFELAGRLYDIIGVAEKRFTGTEPGTVVGIFLPTMMHPSVNRSDSTWHRTFAIIKPGIGLEPLRQKLNAVSLAFERQRATGFTNMSKQNIESYLHQTVMLESARSGASDLQRSHRGALVALAVLVASVMLIGCGNVANLMTAQAAARAREMALRVSIGAGRARLLQLVLVESAMLAVIAATIGAAFSWWSAPLIVRMINPPDNPARLFLPADARVFSFGVGLTLGVALLFGLMPALRASAVKPASALKGGDNPHSRGRTMHALIAAQVAFSLLVLFVAGLFVVSFKRLSNQSNGFASDRLLALETVAQAGQTNAYWDQVAERLRAVPGVEKVALASWPLLAGENWNDSISVQAGPPSDDLAYFLSISPGWMQVMKIPFIDGRDFHLTDTYPGAAIVNETFAKRYFKGENVIGKVFEQTEDEGARIRLQIVGLVPNARYSSARQPIPPTVYVPFRVTDKQAKIRRATFMVRTWTSNPISMAAAPRKEVSRTSPEFRVSNLRSQTEIDEAQTVRERLLAMLGSFFATIALLLACVGLYGVLDYSVLQRYREIGIRMALGAQARSVTRLVAGNIFLMVILGAAAGLWLGVISARYMESLFYEVKVTDVSMLALPSAVLLAAVLLSTFPVVLRAVRIDPVTLLRVS